MDKIIEIYNNYREWYMGIWYDLLGEDGVNIIQGIMGIIFVVACFIGVYMLVDVVERKF